MIQSEAFMSHLKRKGNLLVPVIGDGGVFHIRSVQVGNRSRNDI